MLGFSVDEIGFHIEFNAPIKQSTNLDKVVLYVYPILNGKRVEDDSVCINLYNLAIIYQRLKIGVKYSEVLPYMCVCGDNGCIGVFNGLEQNITLLRVEWVKPKEAEEDLENPEYAFLEKRKYSFNKKALLKEINDLFERIQTLQTENKDTIVYDVEAFFSLENAMLLWKGEEPVFEKKEDALKKALEGGEDIDFNEVLSVKDIIAATTTKTKDSKSVSEVKSEDTEK